MPRAYRQRTKPPVSRKRLEAYHCHSLRLLIDTRRFRSSQHCQHLSFHPLQVHHSLELLLLWRHSNNEPRTKHEHQRRTAQTQDSSLASSDCVITSTFVSCSVCTRYIYCGSKVPSHPKTCMISVSLQSPVQSKLRHESPN